MTFVMTLLQPTVKYRYQSNMGYFSSVVSRAGVIIITIVFDCNGLHFQVIIIIIVIIIFLGFVIVVVFDYIPHVIINRIICHYFTITSGLTKPTNFFN